MSAVGGDAAMWESLEDLGGSVQFFAQACCYLQQHPDGRPGQPFVMNDAYASLLSLITGSLTDLLREAGGATSSMYTGWEDGVLVLRVATQVQSLASAGARLLRGLCQSWTLSDAGLEARITAASFTAGLAALPLQYRGL